MPSDISRRSVLQSVAGLGAVGSAATAGAASAPSLSVMTRNLYVGVDLSRLFAARSMADVRDIAARMLREVRRRPYEARAEAIAAEIERTAPDLVGVQEAAAVRTQSPGDFGDDPSRNADGVEVDLLDLLASKLAARGLDYEVAVATVTTDVEVPADLDGRAVDVRLTDRTAVLVRGDVAVEDARGGVFDATLLFRMPDADVVLRRGYGLVDVTVGGRGVSVATAHLESTDPNRRRQQAAELLDLLPADRPVVLAGDLNSGPGGPSGAYDLLAGSFDDAYASLQAGEGPTCCHPPDLRNDRSVLSRRIDAVLYRGGLRPAAVERVGAAPSDRTTASVDGEPVHVWPSDHAGVVATLAFATPTPTATASATRTPTATRAPSDTPSPSGAPASRPPEADRDPPSSVSAPGFGPLGAGAALVVAAVARYLRD